MIFLVTGLKDHFESSFWANRWHCRAKNGDGSVVVERHTRTWCRTNFVKKQYQIGSNFDFQCDFTVQNVFSWTVSEEANFSKGAQRQQHIQNTEDSSWLKQNYCLTEIKSSGNLRLIWKEIFKMWLNVLVSYRHVVCVLDSRVGVISRVGHTQRDHPVKKTIDQSWFFDNEYRFK